MKNPFDRIVGPDGEWRPGDRAEDGGAGKNTVGAASDLTEREAFALRCLNAAANLYGALTMEDFASLYNGYAKDHPAPISDEMTVAELDDLVDRLQDLPEPEAPEEILEHPEVWFATWPRERDGRLPRLIVFESMTTSDDVSDDTPRTPKEMAKRRKEEYSRIQHRIAGVVSQFKKIGLRMLPESEFLEYEEPMYSEDTEGTEKLSEFLQKEYGLVADMADLDVWGIQSNIRCNGAKMVHALEFIRDACDWEPASRRDVERLIDALAPVVDATRTWEFRGRSQQEAYRLGLVPQYEHEDIYDVFDLGGCGDDDDDDFDDGFDDGDYITPADIPLSRYDGPIDFRFVKDEARRMEKLGTYEDVRQVTRDFVREHVMKALTKKARKAAAVRLGFLRKGDKLEQLDPTLDCVVGDFASMMDDQDGDPAFWKVFAKKDRLGDFDARAASYYANYRYTWLEVLAAKAGVGVKCRDLLTGEELFLMETSFSQGDVKGMTICTGIAPMEDVWLALGVIAPANFENPATILKIVLSGLGLPTEIPVKLSFADQAKFAAETIRRIHANGRFDTLVMG